MTFRPELEIWVHQWYMGGTVQLANDKVEQVVLSWLNE